jgi:uncharacterized membrane protein YcaP (DUF421 family)
MIRGSLVYWFLFLLFRFVLRRDAGGIGLADILVIVLIADASQNGMTGKSNSVGEAFVLVGTIAGWNYGIDWLAFHHKWFARFAEARPVPLIRHGTVIPKNLKREMLTDEDLQSHLREHGVEKLSQVKQATLEPDGSISVVRYSSEESSRNKNKTPI